MLEGRMQNKVRRMWYCAYAVVRGSGCIGQGLFWGYIRVVKGYIRVIVEVI